MWHVQCVCNGNQRVFWGSKWLKSLLLWIIEGAPTQCRRAYVTTFAPQTTLPRKSDAVL